MERPCSVLNHPWWQWHPAVGIAVLLLGATAMAMPLLKEHWKTPGKVFWGALMTLLVGLELWSIHWTEEWNKDEKAYTECIQERRLTDIAEAAKSASKSAENASDKASQGIKRMIEINATTRETLAQQTGGHQACILDFGMPLGQNANGRTIYRMMVWDNGPLPLDYCFMHITDASPIKSAEEAERRFQGVADGQLGPLAPGKVPGKKGTTEGRFTNIQLAEGAYYIQITTRNDRFYETLNQDTRVKPALRKIEVRDEWGKIIYSDPPVK